MSAVIFGRICDGVMSCGPVSIAAGHLNVMFVLTVYEGPWAFCSMNAVRDAACHYLQARLSLD